MQTTAASLSRSGGFKKFITVPSGDNMLIQNIYTVRYRGDPISTKEGISDDCIHFAFLINGISRVTLLVIL